MTRKRWNYNDVKSFIEKDGHKLLSLEKDIVDKKGFVQLKTKISIVCNICGKEFTTNFDSFKSGKRHYECGRKKASMNKRYTNEEVKEYFEKEGYTILSKYETCETPMDVICPKGHHWQISFSNFKKYKCPHCNKIKKNKQELEEAIKVLNEYGYEFISILENLNGFYSDSIITFKCNKGHITQKSISNILSRRRKCKICKESKGENEISVLLQKNNLEYIPQYRFDDCKFYIPLPFDFYLPQYNCCIEFDGIQHFEIVEWFGGLDGFVNTIIRDTVKNEYCKKNNIKLIRIPYYEIENIEDIIKNELTL